MSGLITIVRQRQVVNNTTFGKMYFTPAKGATILVGVTAERPWLENKKGESCIPCGLYKLEPHNSAKHGSVVAFVNPELAVYHQEAEIPKELLGKARSACLIHAANWAAELEGCVAPGKAIIDFGPPKGLGVSSSRPTLNELRALWGMRDGLSAKIRWE